MARVRRMSIWHKSKVAVGSDRHPKKSALGLANYIDLYFTEQPYGFVCGFETGLPDMDSSSATFT